MSSDLMQQEATGTPVIPHAAALGSAVILLNPALDDPMSTPCAHCCLDCLLPDTLWRDLSSAVLASHSAKKALRVY